MVPGRLIASSLLGRYSTRNPVAPNNYWILFHRFNTQAWAPPLTDPRFGWLSPEIDPETLLHEDTDAVGERRPVLLFGSSHVRYNLATTLRNGALLEETSLGEDYALLNYAVGAYGLGQSLVLCHAVLPLFEERHPLVIFALMIDRDLSRAPHSLRQLPKPALDLDGNLKLRVIPPTTTDTAEYLDSHKPEITSYAWRYLLYGTTVLSDGRREEWMHVREAIQKREVILFRSLELAANICKDAQADLVVVILQESSRIANPPASDWRLDTARASLAALEIPYVMSGPILAREAKANGLAISDYYNQGKLSPQHPNDRGMQALFKAYEAAINGDFETK